MLCFPDAHPRRVSDRGRDGDHVGGRRAWRGGRAAGGEVRSEPDAGGDPRRHRRVRLRRADDQHPGGARDQRPPCRRGARRRSCWAPGGRSSSWPWCWPCRPCSSRTAASRRSAPTPSTWAWPPRSPGSPSRRSPPGGSATPRARVVGGVLGAFAATLVSAVLTGLWLGLSGLYPLVPVVQLLLVSHVAIGLLEAALTGAVLATVVRWRPDLRSRRVGRAFRRVGPRRGGRPVRRRHRGGGVPVAVRVGAAGRARSRGRAPRVRRPRGRLVARAISGLRGAVPFVTRDRHGRRRRRRHASRRRRRVGREPRSAAGRS